MAVKYSKQRDFGAKGRKSLKLGGKMWTIKSNHSTKAKATKSAKAWRKKGYNARVLAHSGFYATKSNRWRVLTHTK